MQTIVASLSVVSATGLAVRMDPVSEDLLAPLAVARDYDTLGKLTTLHFVQILSKNIFYFNSL